jgi:hypothetical protein
MPRGTPKTIAPAVLQAIKLLVDQKQSASAVGREYGISGGRVTRIWASCADEPEAGPLVKHDDKNTRKLGQFTVKVGKTAAAKLASSSGSSVYSNPIPAQKAAPKSKTRATAPPEVAEFEVLAAAVQAQGGPKYADERTVDDAIELLTTLRKSRAISVAQYTRTLQSLTANAEHQQQTKPRASKRAESKRQRYAPPDEYSESEPSGGGFLGGRRQHRLVTGASSGNGAAAGAALGSAAAPGVGTAIGSATGGMAGAPAGKTLSKGLFGGDLTAELLGYGLAPRPSQPKLLRSSLRW